MRSFSPASFTVGSNATVRLRVDGMDCPMSPLETADSALLKNDIRGVAELVGLSRTTLANVKANVALALGSKAIFLVTTVLGITGMWIAVLADTGATVLVTMNARRLLRYRFH